MQFSVKAIGKYGLMSPWWVLHFTLEFIHHSKKMAIE